MINSLHVFFLASQASKNYKILNHINKILYVTSLLFKKNTCQRILQFLFLFLFLLLSWFPAYAANYTFPGFLPLGCSGSNSSYSCGDLYIGPMDTITISPPIPPIATTRITVNGTLNTVGYSNINSGKNFSTLIFEVTGVTSLGAGATSSVMNANIITRNTAVTVGLLTQLNGSINTGAGAVTLKTSSIIDGSISTTSGIITTGNSVQVAGDITATDGGVTIGDNSTLGGSISTAAGIVTIGNTSKIIGNITTSAGGVTISDNSTLGGSISTAAGVVTIGDYAKIAGNITTAAGAVNVGIHSSVNGLISTNAGVVTIGTDNVVKGTITTSDAAVNVGARSNTGAISITNAGVVTVGANSHIYGFITTVSGAINVGASSQIDNYITNTIAGATTLGTNVIVGGGVSSYGALTTGLGTVIGGGAGTDAGAIVIGGTVSGSVCSRGAGAITLKSNTRVLGNVQTNSGALTLGINSRVEGSVTSIANTTGISYLAGAYAGSTISSSPCDVVLQAPPKPARLIKSRAWRQIFMH